MSDFQDYIMLDDGRGNFITNVLTPDFFQVIPQELSDEDLIRMGIRSTWFDPLDENGMTLFPNSY